MRGGSPGLLVLAYVILGAFVAGIYNYFARVSTIEGVRDVVLGMPAPHG